MTGDVSKRFRLGPEDEYPHAPDASLNYNESVYANAFDARTGLGGWMRLGNRINEGVAEMSVCLYLPDGRLACQFQKPSITTHETFSAGGLAFEVKTPLSSVSMSYRGDVFLLDDPALLEHPKQAFADARRVPCTVEWHQTSLSPAHGGEPVSEDQPTAYGRDFSLGHFNLHTKVEGRIALGEESFDVAGFGWRDHSWGPRYWQNLFAHRLLTANFGPDLGLMIHKIEDQDGTVRRIGTVLVDGGYEEVGDLDLTIDWNDRREPTGAQIGFRTAKRRGAVAVKVRSVAPLRNRREHGGKVLTSRILESAAAFELDGRSGYGIFELVERLEDGKLTGFPL
jgi:hypothetical protein